MKKLLILIILIIFLMGCLENSNTSPQKLNYEIKSKEFIEITEINDNITFFNENIEMNIGPWKVKLYQGDIEINITEIVNFKIKIISNIDIELSNIGLSFNDTSNKFLENIYLNNDKIKEDRIYETNYIITGSEKNYRFYLMDINYNSYYSKEFRIQIVTPNTELNIKSTFDESYIEKDNGLYFFQWNRKENNEHFPNFIILEGSYENSKSDHSINIESNFKLYNFKNKSLIIGFVNFLSRDNLLDKEKSYSPKYFIESDFQLSPGKYEIHSYYRNTGYGYTDPWKIMILEFEIN